MQRRAWKLRSEVVGSIVLLKVQEMQLLCQYINCRDNNTIDLFSKRNCCKKDGQHESGGPGMVMRIYCTFY